MKEINELNLCVSPSVMCQQGQARNKFFALSSQEFDASAGTFK